MKRRSVLHLILEVIVILGFLVLGSTISTFVMQEGTIDRIFIGIIVAASGVLELTDFFTWKFATKIRSIQTFVAAVLSIALGLCIILIKMDFNILCCIWGATSIAFALVKISTGAVNLPYQPLINGVKIILSIVEIVFSILLIVEKEPGIKPHIIFLGIAFIIEAVTLFIEFMIHRYQRI